MTHDAEFKITMVIDAIREEGGKINMNELQQKLKDKRLFSSDRSQDASLELETVLQDLILSKIIKIEFNDKSSNLWAPVSSIADICLIQQ